MMQQSDKKRTALITGASAGIGEAFARVFAKNGFDLVLTARREEKLQKLANELEDEHGVTAHIIPADLAKPETPQMIFDAVSGKGITIGALVNNAGYGVPGMYRRTSWEQQRDFIQVLVTSGAHLAHLFEPMMVKERYGRIINVASLAGLIPPSGGHTLYGAAKAFMIRFSEAHNIELKSVGVHVTALCPGFTYSEFHDIANTRKLVDKLPGFMWMDAERVAIEGYEAVMRGKPVHVNGRVNAFIALLSKHLPGWLIKKITRSQEKKFRNLDG